MCCVAVGLRLPSVFVGGSTVIDEVWNDSEATGHLETERFRRYPTANNRAGTEDQSRRKQSQSCYGQNGKCQNGAAAKIIHREIWQCT